MPTRRELALWLALFAALILLKWPTLSDPPFWDALGGYVPQARFIKQFGHHWHAYRQLEFIRPPLFTGSMAVLMALGVGRFGLHLYSLLVGLAVLPATFAIARGVGASRASAWLATIACAASPLYFAQLGLLQTDMMATAWVALAWGALLARRRVAFALLASLAVLTKESSYFIWLPAIWLEWRRERSIVRAIAPVLLPLAAAVGWQIAHHALVGNVINDNYRQNFRLDNVAASLYHDFVEGGRLVLWLCAVWAVLERRSDELVATVAAAAALALLFPFGLPRYMLPSLPLLCAAAGLGIEALRPARRGVAVALVAIGLAAGYFLPHWDTWRGHHMDANLRYRRLLEHQKLVAEAIAAEHPTRVLCAFPMTAVLAAPPEDGFLPAPLPTAVAHDDTPLAELCLGDLLVRDVQGESLEGAYHTLDAAGALTLWRTFGEGHHQVQVYRVACPTTAR